MPSPKALLLPLFLRNRKMNATRKRNQQIVQMREQGILRRDVAQKYGLTPERIRMIEREAAAEKSLAERRARLREEIRKADDLDKPWAVADLLDALWLVPVARIRLLEHFAEKIRQTQISLRELMDLVISDANDSELTFASTPMLGIRGIGRFGYHSVIAELTEMDLGPGCNEEWRGRLIKLKRHWNIPSLPPNPRHRSGD